jgi:hypothetical protein
MMIILLLLYDSSTLQPSDTTYTLQPSDAMYTLQPSDAMNKGFKSEQGRIRL